MGTSTSRHMGLMGVPTPTSDGNGAVPGHAKGAGQILVVDDERPLLRSLQRILEADSQQVTVADDPERLDELLDDPALDVVLVDLVMGRTSGLDVLERVKRERPEVEVVVMTGHASIESAVGCMRSGAFDYLQKPFDDVHRVRTTVRKAVERRCLLRRNRELEEELRGRDAVSGLIGSSPAIRAVLRSILSLRHNESSVVIRGESGTGKELAARALHATSPRAEGPFVTVDCGAIPESIFESELFGHVKGAFTGAVGAEGLFRKADGGTLFLDEVGELPPGVQVKLLRALQQREVRPVGASQPIPVDIRVVCATHRDLATMVEDGTFRADLYYRLNVVTLDMPPLRDRPADVPILVHHFVAKHRGAGSSVATIDEDALAELAGRAWHGNVRELENVVESALALASGTRLRSADLQPAAGRVSPDPIAPGPDTDLPLSLEAYERSALERALREEDGDATAAARRLGIGRSTFYRKLAKLGVRVRDRAPQLEPGVGAPWSIR
jgi:two-component system response regulator HydG